MSRRSLFYVSTCKYRIAKLHFHFLSQYECPTFRCFYLVQPFVLFLVDACLFVISTLFFGSSEFCCFVLSCLVVMYYRWLFFGVKIFWNFKMIRRNTFCQRYLSEMILSNDVLSSCVNMTRVVIFFVFPQQRLASTKS